MSSVVETRLEVPYFRPALCDAEIEEVADCLRSGWLTTGPKVQQFEREFVHEVKAAHGLALNSCTAALHLAVEALGLGPGQAVLVPTMTFAATAEVVRYQGAVPILVDCDPVTLNLDLADAERKLAEVWDGSRWGTLLPVGIMPVHVGGLMLDMEQVKSFAHEHGLWIVEDAAHAFPAAFRSAPESPWQRCGENTADVTCFSFYANKTMTTGEGGMAVTENEQLLERMRRMALHGLSRDAWDRYRGGSWDYRIVAPGYKYNLTDIAAAIGLHQLRRAEEMREQRLTLAERYSEAFADLEQLELPPIPAHRIHAWHLFPIRLRLDELQIGRNEFIEELRQRGIGCSVHWRPLHLHPYYAENLRWEERDLPVATQVWETLISLPLFPSMRQEEQDLVILTVVDLCEEFAKEKSTARLRRAKRR